MFEDILLFIINNILDGADLLLMPIVEILPNLNTSVADKIYSVLQFVSMFFPIEVAITYLIIYIQFQLSVIIAKLSFKLFVPFVG